jgi:acyl dehydratase
MLQPGVYSKKESKMLAEWKERTDKLVGWLKDTSTGEDPPELIYRVASKDMLLQLAYAADPRNPFWRDENYARNTRWGGLIGYPMLIECMVFERWAGLLVDPEIGTVQLGGPNMVMRRIFEMYKPIRVGDTFKAWICRPKIQDITEPRSNIRKFCILDEGRCINQNDEMAGLFRMNLVTWIWPKGTKLIKDYQPVKEFIYTKEDIEIIDRMYAAEKRRGADPLFWEDVKVGDTLSPVVEGPVTPMDTVVAFQGWRIPLMSMTEQRRLDKLHPIHPFLVNTGMSIDPVTNITHKLMEWHLTERGAQLVDSPCTNIVVEVLQGLICRLITNWAGDDAFVRKIDMVKMTNPPLGDTVFAYGKVIKKYRDEEGNFLVDIEFWNESVRGFVPYYGTATVCLVARETYYK